MSSERPRVLLLGHDANPEYSSAALVGWSLAQALGRKLDVHLVTHARNAEAIERAGWSEGREFSTIDPGRIERPILRAGQLIQKLTGLGWTFTTALSTIPYAHFESLVWKRFGDDLRAGKFDLVHRVTPMSPVVPSIIAKRCQRAGVPFVLGPINGGVPWPKEFKSAMRKEGEWLSILRAGHKLVPGYRSSRRASAAILAGSEYVWREFEGHHDRCVYLPENAIDPERVSGARGPREEGPLRVAFVGRLVALKGVDMLVEAAAPLVRAGKVVLDLIGDGPERAALDHQIEAEGIADRVTISGWIHDQRQIAPRLARADVLGFPSVREFGGGAVLEAMALGLTPIVVDYGGPGELVTEKTGFRIPIGERKLVVAGFRKVLSELAEDPDHARAVGMMASDRVQTLYTWEVKTQQLMEIYQWVLGRRDRPDFGMPFPDQIADLSLRAG